MSAPAVIVGDIIAVQIVGLVFGQTTITTFHWRINSLTGATTLTGLLNAITPLLIGDFVDLCSNEWSAEILRGRRVTPVPTRSYEVNVGSVDGTVVSEALPPSVAGVISRFTNAPGPSGRGRIFVPGVPASFHDNGLLTAAGLAAYQAFSPLLDLPLTLPGVGELDPVLFRRPNLAVNVEGSVARTVLRSQRRREVGVGI